MRAILVYRLPDGAISRAESDDVGDWDAGTRAALSRLPEGAVKIAWYREA